MNAILIIALLAQLWPNPGPGRAAAGGGGGGATIDAGFSFRNTLGYVTDGAGDQFIAPTDTFPTTNTIGGFSTTYGWNPLAYEAGWPSCSSTVYGYDRNSGVDARLAGMHLILGGGSGDAACFGVQLAATGQYDVVLAVGDAAGSQGPVTISLYDGTSLLSTIVTGASPASGEFYDAGGNLRTSAANWVSSGSTVVATVTMTTTKLAVKVAAAAGGSGMITYMHVTNH